MWDADIRSELLAANIIRAIEIFCLRGDDKVFGQIFYDLRAVFPALSEEDAWQVLGLCMNIYGARKCERAELAVTAPVSFKLKARKIHEVMETMLLNAKKSITLTGYSVSDYFSEMIDLIIRKSQKGVYVRLYLNDYEKYKTNLKRLMDLRNKHLRVFLFQKKEDDALAALHAKTIVVDEKELLVSSANLSYHGMQGNIEMGIRLESENKAGQIESLLREMVSMKIFRELRKD